MKKKDRKDELDHQLVSLCKKRDAYQKLIYYYGENRLISELKDDVDKKISRLVEIYSLI